MRFAQASACSSRSLPQNSSPSAVVKLGAPKTPEHLRRLDLRPQAKLDFVRLRRFECGWRIDIHKGQDLGQGVRLIDPAVLDELRRIDGDGKVLAPALRQPDQRHTRRQHAVLRKRIGTAERQIEAGGKPLHVAPHVAPLRLVEIEWRSIPPAPGRSAGAGTGESAPAHSPRRQAAACEPPPDRSRSRRNRTRNRGRDRSWLDVSASGRGGEAPAGQERHGRARPHLGMTTAAGDAI